RPVRFLRQTWLDVANLTAGPGALIQRCRPGDDGPGFDPASVPAHRYGLRESIHGRMSTVGGRAEVTSAPGAGTRIRLEWSGVH
ncbi:hypothetical protein ABZV78_28715, partial [Micromonospora sp. NPDC004540]